MISKQGGPKRKSTARGKGNVSCKMRFPLTFTLTPAPLNPIFKRPGLPYVLQHFHIEAIVVLVQIKENFYKPEVAI